MFFSLKYVLKHCKLKFTCFFFYKVMVSMVSGGVKTYDFGRDKKHRDLFSSPSRMIRDSNISRDLTSAKLGILPMGRWLADETRSKGENNNFPAEAGWIGHHLTMFFGDGACSPSKIHWFHVLFFSNWRADLWVYNVQFCLMQDGAPKIAKLPY